MAGFSPELAVVTIGGGEKLEEPLVIRPTSETIIGHAYAKWIQSYRDLPVLINQWNSVVRWELRTKLFLRTLEFFWQEGHTAHATFDEAEAETRQMLDIYTDFAVNEAAIPVIPGRKSASERFAGADQTYSIEAMMGDGKALQAGTSHNLGQNFAKAFQHSLPRPRRRAAILLDDVVGAFDALYRRDHHGARRRSGTDPAAAPGAHAGGGRADLQDGRREGAGAGSGAQGARGAGDGGDPRARGRARGHQPGLQVQRLGDARRAAAHRDRAEGRGQGQRGAGAARQARQGREVVRPAGGFGRGGGGTLVEIQKALLDRARAFRDAHTKEPENYDEFKAAVETGFALAFWCGSEDCEAKIKEETKATVRCIPLRRAMAPGACILCGEPLDGQGHLRPRLLAEQMVKVGTDLAAPEGQAKNRPGCPPGWLREYEGDASIARFRLAAWPATA